MVYKSTNMNKLYTLVIVCLLTMGCSKDFLKNYDDRIVGVWRLADVDRRGWGGDIDRVVFTEGQFTFSDGGVLSYRTNAGLQYNGSWNIRKEWIGGDRRVNALIISAVEFNLQDVKTEYFDEIVFMGTNYFKAFIYSGFHRYVFHFRR